MLTEKDYCDYDTCVALEEVGMLLKTQIVRSYAKEGIQTSKIYPNRPSLYEAQKWLREEKKIEVLALSKGMVGAPYDAQVYTEDYVIQEGIEYNSYEEALSEGIKEAVKILKENK